MHEKRLGICLLVVLSLSGVGPATLSAQQAKVDSLEARIRVLEARLDSLLTVLAGGELPETAAEAAATELEALRAALQAAAAEQPAPDTTGEQRSRIRNLNVLNPELSATGDVIGTYTAPAEGRNSFSAVPREFELGLQAVLDPYSYTKIFVAFHDEVAIAGYPAEEEAEDGGGHVHVEEGYFYYIGLPIGLKIGKFRQEIGLYNRWHTHALFEIDRPLPTVAFLGDDGLIQTGLSFTFPVVTTGSGTHIGTLEITRSENEALFGAAKEISFLGNVRSFWDLGASTYLQFGATGVYGENNDAADPFDASLLALDVSFRWRPPRQAMYKDFNLKAEYYFARREFAGSELKGEGGYVQTNFRLNRRWIVGFRADYLDDYGGGGEFYQLVPSLTWWQTEWVFFRLQYNYLKPRDGDGNHTVLLQTIWSVGPHRHETY
jgi:hypothetical protein